MNIVFQKYILAAGSLILSNIVGCANAPQIVTEQDKPRTSFTEEAEGRAVTNAAALKVKAHNFIEIDFKQGSALLRKSTKTSLTSVIDQANKDGKITEVIVLSWSDKEYPSKNLAKLPKRQRDLAKKRNTAIEEYVKTISSVSVVTYNMAEQPNALSKWFNTTDSKLKESFIAAGLPTTADALQYPSKASHSVVLVKVE
jgi:hypothetical protein